MEWDKVRKLIAGVCGDQHAPTFSRREMLAAIGLAGVIAAAPKLLASSPAEARTNSPVAPEVESGDPANATKTEDTAVDAGNTADATEFSARHRYWHRRYYRRRRYYWRRRYWRPRYYRRRYWRRRYYRRRYWY
jgi:hypothetical protein